LSDVSKACSLLLQCGCVVACKGNCKCHRTGLHCSPLCKCEAAALTTRVKCEVHATFLFFVLMMYTTETARFLCINGNSILYFFHFFYFLTSLLCYHKNVCLVVWCIIWSADPTIVLKWKITINWITWDIKCHKNTNSFGMWSLYGHLYM